MSTARRRLDRNRSSRMRYADHVRIYLVDGRPVNTDQGLIDQSAQNGSQEWRDDGNPEVIGEVSIPDPRKVSMLLASNSWSETDKRGLLEDFGTPHDQSEQTRGEITGWIDSVAALDTVGHTYTMKNDPLRYPPIETTNALTNQADHQTDQQWHKIFWYAGIARISESEDAQQQDRSADQLKLQNSINFQMLGTALKGVPDPKRMGKGTFDRQDKSRIRQATSLSRRHL